MAQVIVHEPRHFKTVFVAPPVWYQIKAYCLYLNNPFVTFYVTCAYVRETTLSEGGGGGGTTFWQECM